MTRVVVNPGICGMTVIIEVVKISKRRVRIEIASDCEMVTRVGESLAELGSQDVFKSLLHSEVYRCASECKLHATCPVPMAILKAIEVETGLALPQPVLVRFETITTLTGLK